MNPIDETARIAALRELDLLDTPPSESFDRITRTASRMFGLPIAAISLTDTDRQWFKSRVGVSHDTIARIQAPCAQVTETHAPLVIPDLAADAAYADSPLARSGIRFYAGAPLVTKDGHGLGALCVLGQEPRTASAEDLAALTDLAAMVMAQIDLRHAFGRTEPVSGLPNRAQFLEDLEDLAQDHPGQRRFVVLVDLARPDQLNTLIRVMGASFIDRFVKDAGDTIRAAIEPSRAVYHVAATQFAFVSPADVDQAAYLKIVEAGMAVSIETSLARFVTTIAIGIVPVALGTITPQDILRAAYSAAQDAQDSEEMISLFTASSDAVHRRNIALLQAFGAALETGDQLRLVFQPRIDLVTRRCVGVEALMRWRHPELGDVSPAEFIPVIERTALSRPATAYVLETALAQLARWRAEGLMLPVSINIATSNLEERDFIASVEAALRTHAIPPELLELELTESAMMENSVIGLARLESLAAIGIRVAIDDFGTGHSSLAYLQTLPASVVKIDKTFVDPLGTADDDRDRTLLQAMIGMSRELGFRVVAEGVETEDAANILTRMRCDEAQGFIFARPLEADDVAPWIGRFNAQALPPPPDRRAA